MIICKDKLCPQGVLLHDTKQVDTGGWLPPSLCPCYCLSLKMGSSAWIITTKLLSPQGEYSLCPSDLSQEVLLVASHSNFKFPYLNLDYLLLRTLKLGIWIIDVWICSYSARAAFRSNYLPSLLSFFP